MYASPVHRTFHSLLLGSGLHREIKSGRNFPMNILSMLVTKYVLVTETDNPKTATRAVFVRSLVKQLVAMTIISGIK
jgi:hypothetical protein